MFAQVYWEFGVNLALHFLLGSNFWNFGVLIYKPLDITQILGVDKSDLYVSKAHLMEILNIILVSRYDERWQRTANGREGGSAWPA